MSQKQISNMHVEQIKRHRKKPTVEVSASLVKKKIKEAEMTVKKSHAYILYECGHILDKEDDPGKVKYVGDENDPSRPQRGLRICPICWEKGIKSPLVTKYKKCGCGAEHIGKKVQPSLCCAACPSSRRAVKGNTPTHIKKANGRLADPNRCFCIHRGGCLTEYDGYAALPCKGCQKFREGPWVADPV